MNGTAVYQENAVTTQSRGRLVVMLYDGAIKFLHQAVGATERGDMVAKGRFITRAQDIIQELNTVLDMEAGGEIARNLRSLYNFMTRRLTDANSRRDTRAMQEVIGLLEELNRGWRAIAL